MVLNLSRNSIENIKPLKNSKKMKILNLSDNSISNIEALEDSTELVNIHLEGNLIKGLENLKSLKSCTGLKNIHLQTMSGDAMNPICGLNGYRNNVLDYLPQIRRLDSKSGII